MTPAYAARLKQRIDLIQKFGGNTAAAALEGQRLGLFSSQTAPGDIEISLAHAWRRWRRMEKRR